MVAKLLADRFQLTFHREKKELAVYAITLAKGGPKLTPSDGSSNLPGLFFRGPGNLPARNATMTDFAGVMQSAVLDRVEKPSENCLARGTGHRLRRGRRRTPHNRFHR